MSHKKRKREKPPESCGRCRHGYVSVPVTIRDEATGTLIDTTATRCCLCALGVWRHQQWRKHQFSRPT